MASEQDVASLQCSYDDHIFYVRNRDLPSEGEIVLRVSVARGPRGPLWRVTSRTPGIAEQLRALGLGHVPALLCVWAPGMSGGTGGMVVRAGVGRMY